MKKTLALASMALLLATAACGTKNEQTTTVPGVGSVTTTQEGDRTKVQVTGPKGQQATVATSQEGGGTQVQVQVPGGSLDIRTGGSGGPVQVVASGSPLPAGAEDEAGEEGASAGEEADVQAAPGVEPEDFQIPFYPGAKVVGGGSTETTGMDGKSLKVASAQLVTSDPVDKVVAFYADKVQGVNKVDSTVDGQRTVIYAPFNPLKGTTMTVVGQKDGTTKITLASQGT